MNNLLGEEIEQLLYSMWFKYLYTQVSTSYASGGEQQYNKVHVTILYIKGAYINL